ncbi:MAG: hypothetical protein BroJett018_53580 [Chloroflexota bacterium]|nr:MAG: hypothetical protein BroJett018_53580 [Chloroflexota bacterium]
MEDDAMFQNATQFAFSVLFILSLGLVWGILYKVYVKATLEERAEKAKKRPTAPPITNPSDTPSAPSVEDTPPTEHP